MRTMKAADLATGVFITLLGVVTLAASLQIKGQAGERLSPATLPILVGCMILAAGILQTQAAWRYKGDEKIVAWPGSFGRKRVLINIGLMAVYEALLEPLGFVLSTLIYITAGVWYLGKYRWWTPPLTGLLSAVVVLLVFIDFLGLSFPLGPLELFL